MIWRGNNRKIYRCPKDGDFEDIIEDDIIILEECYSKEKRNIDYIENPDKPFIRNYIVYKKENLKRL